MLNSQRPVRVIALDDIDREGTRFSNDLVEAASQKNGRTPEEDESSTTGR